MTQKPCEWRPSNAVDRAKYAGCPALCVDRSMYYSAHRDLVRGKVQHKPKPDRTEYRDADLLPLTADEFAQLAELRERSK